MDYFHCMRCGHWPLTSPEGRRRYFFTSCGRVLCDSCITEFPNQKCPCQLDNCKFVEIGQDTRKDVKIYFAEPHYLLKQAMEQPMKILHFQSSMHKSCYRLVPKLAEAYKASMNKVAALELENEHLKKNYDQMKQQNEQLMTKIREMSASQANVASFLGNSPQQLGSPNDSLNLFREPTPRPNAHVTPNMHLQQKSVPQTPVGHSFSGSRNHSFSNSFVAPSPTPSGTSLQNQNSLFSQMSGFGQNFGVARSANISPATYGTPLSSISQLSAGGGGGMQNSNSIPSQSPFNRRNDQSMSMDGRTPELINRLRNLKCKPTPNSSSSPYGFRL